MKNKDYYDQSFDMYSFGKELIELSKYKDMYYNLLDQHEQLQKEYWESLEQGRKHGDAMMGNLLELAIYGLGGKAKEA